MKLGRIHVALYFSGLMTVIGSVLVLASYRGPNRLLIAFHQDAAALIEANRVMNGLAIGLASVIAGLGLRSLIQAVRLRNDVMSKWRWVTEATAGVFAVTGMLLASFYSYSVRSDILEAATEDAPTSPIEMTTTEKIDAIRTAPQEELFWSLTLLVAVGLAQLIVTPCGEPRRTPREDKFQQTRKRKLQFIPVAFGGLTMIAVLRIATVNTAIRTTHVPNAIESGPSDLSAALLNAFWWTGTAYFGVAAILAAQLLVLTVRQSGNPVGNSTEVP